MLRFCKRYSNNPIWRGFTTKTTMAPLPDYKDLPALHSTLEEAKRIAAYRAVDENLIPVQHRLIGVGSGSTVIYVAERLGQYLLDPKFSILASQFVCIPTGFQSKELILTNGLTLGSIDQYPSIDIVFDGADEVDSDLQLIKGGGGCLFQEKLVSTSAAKFVVVADYRKRSPKYLGTNWVKGVPIEVVPSAYVRVLSDLRIRLKCKQAVLRQGAPAKAGPVVTDNCNFIIDAHFGEIEDPAKLHAQIKMLVGVVETGLFINNAARAYFGNPDGSVDVLG
ncbi:LAMI_0F09494g1_1 [Lachancea mirantina]|uniref:Ribose-5-phosphate isomerase n=1 Tax=Lachancea mirantina TaxID=1230905 RepID=A0A1G4K185_9SACH|nr:LAMI_0F09494g1_1 [Lachancea mirantina]